MKVASLLHNYLERQLEKSRAEHNSIVLDPRLKTGNVHRELLLDIFVFAHSRHRYFLALPSQREFI